MSDLADDVKQHTGSVPIDDVSIDDTVFGGVPLGAAELLNLYEDINRDSVAAICSKSGQFGYVSPACQTILGWQATDLLGGSVNDFVHPEDVPQVDAAMRSALQSQVECIVAHRLRCSDGSYLWVEDVIRQVANPRHAEVPLVMVSFRDIGDRKDAEAALQRQALTDPLTGIANRTAFMDRLEQALRRLERSNTSLAVIYLDLDRFKVINDSLGHEVGDRLLVEVAERASATIRPTDTLARLGGDEFVVLAEGLGDVEEANQLAMRLCRSMEIPLELEGESIVCTTSAGVATTRTFTHTALELLQEADLALYRAKDLGRNRAEVFDEELRTKAVERLATEIRIRRAINDDLFVVHYQPIVDLATGHVVKVEALLRIQEPEELVLPDLFIDVAEETGLLVAIDGYVLSQALGQAAAWARELPGTDFSGVSVNVTGRHLSDAQFVEAIADGLAEHGVAPEMLAVEVTERVLMEASDSSMNGLRAIRRMGVTVGIDDFGTGYSSLAYLRQFPLDFLKIDQSFVQQLGDSAEDLAIVAAIIELAHAIDLTVIAEGVETSEQLQALTEVGCDQIQGFLFGRADQPGPITSAIEARSALAAASGPG